MAAPAPSTAPTFAQRPWVAAGVALTAASMVAATPVAAPTLQQVAFPDIELVAQDLLGDTAGNLTNLIDYFAGANPTNFLVPRVEVGAPFPIMQQIIANQIGYLGQVLQNPGDIGTVFETMFGNLQAGIAAPFGEFGDSLATGGALTVYGLPTVTLPVLGTIDPNAAIEGFIATLIGADNLSRLGLFDSNLVDVLQSVLGVGGLDGLFNFTASPISGLMLGVMGPVLGPMIALANDIGTVFDGNPAALLGIPEHMLYAFLNGGETLSLVDLVENVFGIDLSPTLDLGLLGELTLGVDEAGVALGGILGGPGSLFNALTAQAGVVYDPPILGEFDGGIKWLGDGAGPLGSLLAGQNSIADAISNGTLLGDLDGGLLSAFANGLNIDFLADGLDSVHSFLTANLLDPVAGVLTGFADELSTAITSMLGSDLGIDALTAMLVNIPQLLLTMML
ncbi:hypothetical protein [Mycobacterium sp. 1274756.6]|uniref:hypothetical protein n=1 Tax=Mycobacterium sp. 1274756.6 TaxID=1834076 RepID=UPI000AD7EABD|nr:hypothetical protein [Mycobacterium sp. 1274756.6]